MCRSALLPPGSPTRPEHVVFPALPPLEPGMRVCWVGEYVWDDSPHPEAWARDRQGKLWVSVWQNGSGWTEWARNDPESA